MKQQTIFFDFDGTLLNSFSLYFKTTKHLNPDIDEETYRDIFTLENFAESPHLDTQNINVFFDLIEKHAHLYDLFPGVAKTLHELKKNYNLVIITACPKHIVRYQLGRFKLPYIDKVYGLEKPGTKADKIMHYCSKHDLDVSKSYFVTDTAGDLKQVSTTQISTIAVTYGFNSRDQLITQRPDNIIDTFQDLINIINKHV